MDTSSNGSESQTPQPPVRSSCESCQRRKVRCDKGDPCSTCQKAGLKCEIVTRRRLPRGRNGGRKKADAGLKARIGRLENLVTTLGVRGKLDEPVTRNDTGNGIGDIPQSGYMSRYLGSSFWSSLSTEVAGLREVLDNTSDEELDNSDSDEDVSSRKPSLQGFNFLLCGPDSFVLAPDAVQHPPKIVAEALCTIYLNNVDPLFKLLHGPSIRHYLQEGKPYLDYQQGNPAVEALTFAIYYAGLNTQDEQGVKHNFGFDKMYMLNKFRFALVVSLAQADFVNSEDITTLQALVIFLASVRLNDSSRWSWTLLGLAVRIAHALRLPHLDTSMQASPFHIEMRRRLWHQLIVLDLNAAMDRGTPPLIDQSHFVTRFPLNINDSDMSFGQETPIVEREGFTDMMFCKMCHYACLMSKQLKYHASDETIQHPNTLEQTMAQREELATQFRHVLKTEYLYHLDTSIPFQRFAKGVGETMTHSMLLVAVRPLQHISILDPPSIDSRSILALGVTTLETQWKVYDDPSTEPWTWFVWVQWHALAVTVAELCNQTSGPLVERAWKILDIAYEYYSGFVADSKKGMLWRPIQKLMAKARKRRQAASAREVKASVVMPTMESKESFSSSWQESSDSEGPSSAYSQFAALSMTPSAVQHPQQQPFDAALGAQADMLMNTDTGNWTTDPLLMQQPGVMDAMTTDEFEGPFPVAPPGNDPAWMNWGDFVEDIGDFSMVDLNWV